MYYTCTSAFLTCTYVYTHLHFKIFNSLVINAWVKNHRFRLTAFCNYDYEVFINI